MNYLSNQVLRNEINILVNEIPYCSQTEIDLKTQLLIREIENNEKTLDHSVKIDLEKLGKILSFGHNEHLSLQILKLSSPIFENESTAQADKCSPLNREVNEMPLQVASSPIIEAIPVEISKLNTVSSIKEAEAEEINSSHVAAYVSLTRRFTPVQHEQIERIAQERSKEIDEMCEAAHQGNLNHPIFDKANVSYFPLLAVAAYKVNKLSLDDCSSLVTYANILKYHNKEDISTVNIFTNDGEIDQEVQKMLLDTMEQNTSQTPSLSTLYSNPQSFSEEQLVKFYATLKKLSPLQQRFWVVQDLQGPLHDGPYKDQTGAKVTKRMLNGKTSISQTISESIGFNLFSRIKNTENRILADVTLFQAYQDAKHEHSVKLERIFGFGNLEDLHNDGLNDTRIVSLGFPLEGLCDFTRADGFMVHQDYDMTYHDAAYHGDVVSRIPPLHRRLFILLASSIKEVCQRPEYTEFPEVQLLGGKLYNRLVDMEFEIYKRANAPDLTTCFFNSLTQTLTLSTVARCAISALLEAKENLGRDLSSSEMETIRTEHATKGMELVSRANKKDVMLPIAEGFVEKMVQSMARVELVKMCAELEAIVKEYDNIVLNQINLAFGFTYLGKIAYEGYKRDHSSFPEATKIALKKYLESTCRGF